ncbi:MAG: hypothetical protein CVT98_09170, partial [Bacteroidetes bacterium HGW-Bacteroidetes-15]
MLIEFITFTYIYDNNNAILVVMNTNNLKKYKQLREKYPCFTYEKYHISIDNEKIIIKYFFNINKEYFFEPSIEILFGKLPKQDNLSVSQLENLVFHIGMIELISYWKASCSPKLIIKAHKLNDKQIKWWKNIYFQGLGEFFYVNMINANIDDFINIETTGEKLFNKQSFTLNDNYIVPVGGGKDSIVSLQLLKKSGLEITPLIMNPREASEKCAKLSGFDKSNTIIINRKLDKKLLELNA